MRHTLPWAALLALIVGSSAPARSFAPPQTAQAQPAQTAAPRVAEPAVQAGKYPTVTIRQRKLDEDKDRGVIFMDAAQREARRVTIRDGRVYDSSGAVVPDTRSRHHNDNNYVMDAAGTFYLFDEFTTPTIRHSSIFAGGPVAGAGNIRIVDGRIVYIDSDSGHYPSTRLFPNVLAELAARGVDMSTVSRR